MSKYDQLMKDLRDPHCGDGTTTHIDMRKEAAEAIQELFSEKEILSMAVAQRDVTIGKLQDELDLFKSKSSISEADAAEIYRAAIRKWGIRAQIMMVYEEMAELQKELCKNGRGKNNTDQIADEVADMEIMLAQLKIIFNVQDLVEQHRAFKLERLRNRIEGRE